ncbi:MAG: UDP-N-acetylmuramoyl-L-alanyl-D-glutamate--2,6-diaminopimelate ligase [Bauldia sp.]|nr:UDP-N-acetylmuramoyl-L-alanyl-D-glutamate--2,6-diaminopimelate ligase [Bauldia sp.]
MDRIGTEGRGGSPVRLGELVEGAGGDAGIPITGVTADSRLVEPGFLFVALRGTRDDGSRFVTDAIAAGAAAVVVGSDVLPPVAAIPVLASPEPRHSLALAAARFYPRQPDRLVAVTGTSGKTSVAVFTRQIFEAAGHPAASLGTIGLVDRGRAYPGGLTTPDPVKLHQTLDRLSREGVEHVAIEASSHGLDQHRLDGLRLAAAGFTNLGRDHLDYHPSLADYLAAKLRLFRDLLPEGATAVINADSAVATDVVAAVPDGCRLITVGRRGGDIRLESLATDGLAQVLTLDAFGRPMRVRLPLAGAFQAENALVAAALAIGAGIAAETAIGALDGLQGAPGRLDKVGEVNGAAIFIDYAHKPEAVRAALGALRPMTRGRLIVVLGAGGDRDPGKRPLMGAAAAEAADIVIVTDDNPRSEDPAAIRRAVLGGAQGAIEIGGRGIAIAQAIAMLEPGDVLCIAGKGHETGQIVGSTVLPFSDHDAVRDALRKVAS